MTHESLNLLRDCEAVQIPSGQKVIINSGTKVTITQALGGSFTVLTEDGYMARISDSNADALGREVPQQSTPEIDTPITESGIEKQVWDVLRTCYDPEIPVNIVELGLVYNCKLTPVTDGFDVHIDMTLTAPGCGMGPALQMEAESKLTKIKGVHAASVSVVFDPPWDQSMMSEAAKLQLGFF